MLSYFIWSISLEYEAVKRSNSEINHYVSAEKFSKKVLYLETILKFPAITFIVFRSFKMQFLTNKLQSVITTTELKTLLTLNFVGSTSFQSQSIFVFKKHYTFHITFSQKPLQKHSQSNLYATKNLLAHKFIKFEAQLKPSYFNECVNTV